MEITPGLHRIGDDRIAAYLVVGSDGATLVDAGLAGHRRALRTELTGLGMTESDIRGIVLTHGDSDHLGCAEALRREHGTEVFIHAGDSARVRGLERPPPTATPAWRAIPALGFVVTALRYGRPTRYVREVTELSGGETLALPGAPQILALPGHSPGSIAVHVPSVDAVMVGDALTTRHVLTGVTGPAPAPFTDDPDQAAHSWERLRGLGARWVLPGHGPVWGEGVDALVDALAAR